MSQIQVDEEELEEKEKIEAKEVKEETGKVDIDSAQTIWVKYIFT